MLQRNGNSLPLLETDHNARNAYRLERERNRRINTLEAEVAALKDQLAEINKLVATLITNEK